jgi:DegV family protein with EDD domain
MEKQVMIVTDSTAYLTEEEIERYDIHVIPLKVIFGTEVYDEGKNITNREFYRRIRNGAVPTTSQPARSDFTQIYEELVGRGHPVLSLHISSGLSGTANLATVVKGEFPSAQIEVVDSSSMALRMLVLPAAKAAQAGQTLPQLKVAIEGINRALSTVGALDTLEYLRRGGRIGTARALLGTMLRVKPLLLFAGGELEVLGRVRTSARAIEAIQDIMRQRVGTGVPVHVAVVHTDAPERGEALKQAVLAGFNCLDMDFLELGPVLGTHLGPGFFGVGFYGEAVA